jgi:hypothetical protein
LLPHAGLLLFLIVLVLYLLDILLLVIVATIFLEVGQVGC